MQSAMSFAAIVALSQASQVSGTNSTTVSPENLQRILQSNYLADESLPEDITGTELLASQKYREGKRQGLCLALQSSDDIELDCSLINITGFLVGDEIQATTTAPGAQTTTGPATVVETTTAPAQTTNGPAAAVETTVAPAAAVETTTAPVVASETTTYMPADESESTTTSSPAGEVSQDGDSSSSTSTTTPAGEVSQDGDASSSTSTSTPANAAGDSSSSTSTTTPAAVVEEDDASTSTSTTSPGRRRLQGLLQRKLLETQSVQTSFKIQVASEAAAQELQAALKAPATMAAVKRETDIVMTSTDWSGDLVFTNANKPAMISEPQLSSPVQVAAAPEITTAAPIGEKAPSSGANAVKVGAVTLFTVFFGALLA